MSATLHAERHAATLLLTLDNPRRGNALAPDLLTALAAAAERVEREPEIRAVVLTGAGERAFCTGADITAWASLDPVAFSRQWVAGGHRVFDRLARLPVPLIGAINGAAFGGGLELAATCDLRIATPGALFALPETGIGVTPGWSGAQRLARLLPEALLREMALAGARLTAARLHAIGFLNEIADDPLARALAIAGHVATLAPRAVETTKLVINAAAGEGREAALDAIGSARVAATADKEEGVASFREKRPPQFRGT